MQQMVASVGGALPFDILPELFGDIPEYFPGKGEAVSLLAPSAPDAIRPIILRETQRFCVTFYNNDKTYL